MFDKFKTLCRCVFKLEDRIEKLEKDFKDLERKNWYLKYPNGEICINSKKDVTWAYTLEYYLKVDFDYKGTKIFESDMGAYPIIFKSKKLSNNNYLVYETEGMARWIVNTSDKTSIRVDKNLKVIL